MRGAPLGLALELRVGAEQLLGVGVLGRVEDLVDRPVLDDLAEIHDRDVVGDLGDDADVVGDEQHRHAASAPAAAIRSRICACVVTSSAVVGSSAIRTSGLQASAMAIMTRWRMPPEYSNG